MYLPFIFIIPIRDLLQINADGDGISWTRIKETWCWEIIGQFQSSRRRSHNSLWPIFTAAEIDNSQLFAGSQKSPRSGVHLNYAGSREKAIARGEKLESIVSNSHCPIRQFCQWATSDSDTILISGMLESLRNFSHIRQCQELVGPGTGKKKRVI